MFVVTLILGRLDICLTGFLEFLELHILFSRANLFTDEEDLTNTSLGFSALRKILKERAEHHMIFFISNCSVSMSTSH